MHYVGLDLGLKKTFACIVDDNDKVIKRGEVESEPEAIALWLYEQKLKYKFVGIESGMMHEYIYFGLVKAGYPVKVINSTDSRDFMKRKINKNDKNDAHGIARMLRTGQYREVYVKTEESQRQRVKLGTRRFAMLQLGDTERHIRGILRNFGLKIGKITRSQYETRVRELIEHDADLRTSIEPLLEARKVQIEKVNQLTREVLTVVKNCPVCKILMTCPGVGTITALMFKTTIDTPKRFQNARAVGAAIGLTPRAHDSGETKRKGRISKIGDKDLRSALFEGASAFMMRSNRKSWLREWALQLKEKKGYFKAVVALARKIAMILYTLWIEWRPFRWDDQPAT